MAKKEILNIEIAERLVKVCVCEKKKNSQYISQRFMFQTPAGAVNDGHITDTGAVSAALRAELEERGIRCTQAVFSLISGRVGTREVNLPPVKDNRIKAIVEANVSEYFPVDMSKYHVSYAVQERIEKGDNAGVRLLVMIVPLQILEGYFEVAHEVGLTVQAIDYSGNSVYQTLRRMSNEEMTMYVDIECTTSSVSVLQNGKQLLQRTFTNGVDDLLSAHSNAAGHDGDAYLVALRELSNENGERFLSADETREALSRLVSNIVRIVDYFNSNNWETPVEKLVLTGCGCDVRGLREMVADATSLDTSTLKHIERVKAPGDIGEPLAHYLACIGSNIAPVDFVPPQYAEVKKKGMDLSIDFEQIGTVVLVLGAVMGVALSGWALIDFYSAKGDHRELQAQVDELAYVEDIYNEYTAYTAYADGLAALYALTENPNKDLVAFIGELEVKMPAALTVLSAGFSTTGVNMNMTVSSKEEAAMVISQLRTFDSLSAVEVSGVAEGADQAGTPQVSFAVNCTYGENPWLAGPEAAEEPPPQPPVEEPAEQPPAEAAEELTPAETAPEQEGV
ncbi:MAG: pilus assembly protein PilM [Syntrophomonadaceae bacterium]|nr:pilus assembly protein PilM [Syntrophomonadaceae bacterium]